MGNPFCHIELTTDDLGKAKEFYGSLFEWKLEEMPMEGGSYTMIETGEEPGGGMMATPAPGVPTCWMTYVRVDDAAATVDKARELGGMIHVERTPIPGIGFFAVIADPTGGVIGVFEGLEK